MLEKIVVVCQMHGQRIWRLKRYGKEDTGGQHRISVVESYDRRADGRAWAEGHHGEKQIWRGCQQRASRPQPIHCVIPQKRKAAGWIRKEVQSSEQRITQIRRRG